MACFLPRKATKGWRLPWVTTTLVVLPNFHTPLF